MPKVSDLVFKLYHDSFLYEFTLITDYVGSYYDMISQVPQSTWGYFRFAKFVIR
jgi:hypothetical protein